MSTKRKKKVWIFTIILAVVVVAGLVAMKARGSNKQEPKAPVKIGKAEIADVQVKVTEVGTVQPEVKVDVQSPEKFQGSNVIAPMDGVVLTKNVEIGESITSGVSSFNAGTVMFSIADVSKMIVKAGVNEVDIGKIHVSMPVKVSLDAYPKTFFAGLIDRIAPAVRLEDKVRLFDVEILLDAQGRELRSGMTAK